MNRFQTLLSIPTCAATPRTVERCGGWIPNKFQGHYAQEMLDEVYLLSTCMMDMKLKGMPHAAYRVGRHQVPLPADFPPTFNVLRAKLTDPEFITNHVENAGGESYHRRQRAWRARGASLCRRDTGQLPVAFCFLLFPRLQLAL
jgi:hypothetical protein